MITAAAPTTYTPDEIARLSDQDGKLYELVDGQLVEKPMSKRANRVAGRIYILLSATYPESRACVFMEQPVYCFKNPREMRKPDVALVWAERVPGGFDDDELLIAPDLVVEVVSPTNRYDDVQRRVREYLDAGVSMVWLVGPNQRDVYVHRKDGSLSRYRESDTLKGEPLLPGLSVKVSEFFPAPQQSPAGQ